MNISNLNLNGFHLEKTIDGINYVNNDDEDNFIIIRPALNKPSKFIVDFCFECSLIWSIIINGLDYTEQQTSDYIMSFINDKTE